MSIKTNYTQNVLTVCCENKSKVGMEALPDSERRQERRFNRKGVVMNIQFISLNHLYMYLKYYYRTALTNDVSIALFIAN
jgi:hypothetical protein